MTAVSKNSLKGVDMYKKIVASSLLTILGTVALSTVNAAERQGPPGGGKPPAEAFEACADKSASDSCCFSGKKGDVTGTCITPPRGEEELVCAPEGGRPPQ